MIPRRPMASIRLLAALALAAAGLAGLFGCGSGDAEREAYVPELPSVVEAPPEKPTPADTGLPGSWEPASGLEPTGRMFVVEGGGDEPARAGLVLIPGQWGVQKELRDLARQLATKNLVVAIPDLYDGVVPQTAVAVPELQKGVSVDRAQALIDAALRRCREEPAVAEDRGVFLLGIGAGGPLAFLAGLDPSEPIAGVILDAPTPLPSPDASAGPFDPRLLLMYGESDMSFDRERMVALRGKLEGHEADAEIVAVRGAGSELFDPRAMGHSSAAMKRALERMLQFIGSGG